MTIKAYGEEQFIVSAKCVSISKKGKVCGWEVRNEEFQYGLFIRNAEFMLTSYQPPQTITKSYHYQDHDYSRWMDDIRKEVDLFLKGPGYFPIIYPKTLSPSRTEAMVNTNQYCSAIIKRLQPLTRSYSTLFMNCKY